MKNCYTKCKLQRWMSSTRRNKKSNWHHQCKVKLAECLQWRVQILNLRQRWAPALLIALSRSRVRRKKERESMHEHAACLFRMSLLHVQNMLLGHKALSHCMSTLHSCCMSCCMYCTRCMSVLYVQAANKCCFSMMHVSGACPCNMNMLQVHTVCIAAPHLISPVLAVLSWRPSPGNPFLAVLS